MKILLYTKDFNDEIRKNSCNYVDSKMAGELGPSKARAKAGVSSTTAHPLPNYRVSSQGTKVKTNYRSTILTSGIVQDASSRFSWANNFRIDRFTTLESISVTKGLAANYGVG